MNFRKALISTIVVIVVIVLAAMISQYLVATKPVPETNEKQESVLYVKALPVEYKVNKMGIEATGRLSSQHAVDLSAEVSGMLLPGNIDLKEGMKFKEGDLLIRIFDEEARNNLKASKSRFLNSIAGILPDMKIDFQESYEKWVKFFDDIEIEKPLPDLPKTDSEKEKVFLASRNILNDYYTILSSQIRLSKYNIYAPFNGTYTQVMMEVGSVVNPGSRIATMIKTDKLELEVPVRIDDIYWVNIGDKVIAKTRDRLHSWTGEVIRKSNYLNPETQSIMVYVSLNSTKESPMYQGQYLKAEFQKQEMANTMEIPRNAIFKKEWVYTIVDGKLKAEKINILKTDETSAFISGIEQGTILVVEPLVNAQEGTNAEILN